MTPVSESTNSIDNSAIIIRGVDASWGSNSSINQIDDIDIRIISQKLYAIVGPVGSGKVCKYNSNFTV